MISIYRFLLIVLFSIVLPTLVSAFVQQHPGTFSSASASAFASSRTITNNSLSPRKIRRLQAAEVLLIEETTTAFGLAGSIENFYQTQPYMAAFLTCSVKASAADLMAQKRQLQEKLLPNMPTQKKDLEQSSPRLSKASMVSARQDVEQATMIRTVVNNDKNVAASILLTDETSSSSTDTAQYDVSRNLGFIFYGGLYQGMAQQFLFNNLYPTCFPTLTGWSSVLAQVALDMAIVGPFLCLPLAYVVKALFTTATSHEDGNGDCALLVENTGGIVSNPLDSLGSLAVSIAAGLQKYSQDVQHQSLLLKYWALWIPVQCLTFGVIPAHFRVVFVASVSFLWVFILSSIAASTATPAEQSVDRKER